MKAIECENVELRAGYKTLIRHFALSLNFGESIAITGPNGLGKTTLLRTLCGVSKPYRGQVKLSGRQIWPSAESRHSEKDESVCYLASLPAFFLDHSLASNLEFYVRSHGGNWDPECAKEALVLVGLKERWNQSVRSLSTGQKRRLTVAFLEIIKPRVLLLDEPTNGLDTQGIELCLQTLTALTETTKCALLVATHDPQMISWCQNTVDLKRWAP